MLFCECHLLMEVLGQRFFGFEPLVAIYAPASQG